MTEKKYKKRELAVVYAEPITGALNTVIHPGEQVMMVRSGSGHSVACNKGTYIGYIISKPTGNRRARVAMDKTENVWHWPDGREFNWRKDYDSLTYNSIRPTLVIKERTRIAYITLNLNRIATIK